jgi:hypothetical protein
MDEAIVKLMMGPGRLPRRADYERLGEEIPAARSSFAAHGWLDDPARFHTLPPALDPSDITTTRGRSLGLRYELLRFESGYEPPAGIPGRERWLAHEPNRTAYAWVLRHPDGPRDGHPDATARPWLVCLHAFGTGTPLMDIPGFRAGRLHRDLGVNLVFPTLPLHGPRRIGRISGDRFLTYDHLDSVNALAQSVWDVRRIVAWVRAQGAEQVGLYGISLGSYVAALLAALDDDLACVVAGIPVADFPALFRHHMPPRLARRARRYHLLGPDADAVHRVVSPLAVAPRVPHDSRFVYAGLGDRMSTPVQGYRLWEHWDRPAMRWYAGNHVGFLWSPGVHRFVAESLADSGLTRPA